MKVLRLVWREMLHRRGGSALIVLAVAATCGFVVFLETGADAAGRETRRIQRQSNLRLVPVDADPRRILMGEDEPATLDEGLLDTLARQDSVSMNHLIALLRRRVLLEGQSAWAVGIARSVPTPGRPKAPMHRGVSGGRVELGHGLAEALGKQAGDAVQLFDSPFTVERVLLEKGDESDWTVFGDLAEFQQALGEEGRLSEIRAIECVSCESPDEDPLSLLRAELGRLAPEARVLRDAEQADARIRQRTLVERYGEWIVAALLIAAMLWTGALTWANVRDRRTEVGVLRALGYGGGHVLGLFLGKAVVLGLIGGAIGVAAGTALALGTGQELFGLTEAQRVALPGRMLAVALAAPAFTALAAAVPAMLAAARDPAETLQPR